MVETKNVLFALSAILLVISLFGTYVVLTPIDTSPSEAPRSVQKGKVKLNILPDPGSDSVTGKVVLAILPEGT